MIRMTLTTAASTLMFLAACGTGDLPVRNGPQSVHPSAGALAQRINGPATGHGVSPMQISGRSEARAIFEAYCTPGLSNNDRVMAMMESGRFAEGVPGRLPVDRFRSDVFIFFKLRTGNAQIGFTSRSASENYCVAVDGTAAGTELYVAGP
jgi:hypothetical protein